MSNKSADRKQGKILYLVTEDWYFCSHRLPMARAARDAGFEVVVATRLNNHQSLIEKEGFRAIPLGLNRKGMNPFKELAAIGELIDIYKTERPDIVHHVAMKPVLYGTLAAVKAGVPRIINALAGFGFVFVSNSAKALLLRPFIKIALKASLKRPGAVLILQNEEAREFALKNHLIDEQGIIMIRGSGVDTKIFYPEVEPDGVITGTIVGRMLWSKGIGEAIEAVKILRNRSVPFRLQLVGDPDPANPDSIPECTLTAWKSEGLADWQGRRDDIPKVWAESHMAILPSWGEGLPKSLLEAASCARPMIATDTSGCRELVTHGEDGLLVPLKNPRALADAIQTLCEETTERLKMGARARQTVLEYFSDEIIAGQTEALYLAAMEKEQ